MVVNFLIRKSDSSTFPCPYLCVFLISIYTYGFPSIYIYIFKVSNSYEFELPRMSILLIGIVKIFAPVRYYLRFFSFTQFQGEVRLDAEIYVRGSQVLQSPVLGSPYIQATIVRASLKAEIDVRGVSN